MLYTNKGKGIFSIRKKAKHKPKTTERTEVTLTFHLSGHRLVGLQPVLRVKNIEENVVKNSRYLNTDITNLKSKSSLKVPMHNKIKTITRK